MSEHFYIRDATKSYVMARMPIPMDDRSKHKLLLFTVFGQLRRHPILVRLADEHTNRYIATGGELQRDEQ